MNERNHSTLTLDVDIETGSIGEIIDMHLDRRDRDTQTPIHHLDDVRLSIDNVENASLRVHTDKRSDSIPVRLKTWYEHRSFRSIILASLSMSSIVFAFIGLYIEVIDHCSCLGFVISIITLFSPSPLTHR
jgi:hypothetical protein